MAEISPLRRRMIEDMTVRNLSPDCLGPEEVPRLPDASSRDRDFLAWPQPDRLRTAVLLRGDARSRYHPGADPLCAGAAQVAGGVEHGRGGALPGGDPELDEPQRADDSLCRRIARVGSGWPE